MQGPQLSLGGRIKDQRQSGLPCLRGKTTVFQGRSLQALQ